MSGEWWDEDDERAERMEAAGRERAAARARQEAVIDLPSVLRLASRAVDGLVRRCLDAAGLAEVSLTGLDILGLTKQPMPVVVLADRLKVTPQSVSQAVSQLVKLGLADKEQGYPDRRTVVVLATAEGREVHAQAHKALDDALNFVAEDITDTRLVDITEDLARVADVDRQRHPWNRW